MDTATSLPTTMSTPAKTAPLLSEKTRTVLGSLLVLAIFLAAWEWGPGALGMPEFILPRFSRVMQESVFMWKNSDLLGHFGITAMEVVIGFALGSLLGLAVGVALGLSPRAEAMLSPYILALQSHPRSPSRRCSSCGWATPSTRRSSSPC